MRIVDTDNFDSDYPDEKFILGILRKEEAEEIAEVINRVLNTRGVSFRYYKVVENDYQLQPGFQP
jgi:hypothetical protein